MNTTTHYNETPLAGFAPPSQNGHPAAAGLERSKSAEPSELLAQENKRLAQENARLLQEQARERSLLRTLIDNLPDAIFAKDTAGRKTMANPADLKKLHCKTETEAIGKSDFDFFPKDVAEKFWASDQKVLQGQPIINQEGFFLNDKSEKRWQLTSKLPLRDENGKITGLVGISRDITEQKRTEEALRQSRDELEKRVVERTAELSRERLVLRTLIDSLPDAIYAKDAAGRKTMANPGDLSNLKCKTEAEVIGKTDFDFFPKDIAEKFQADDQRVFHGEPVINREEHFFDAAGQKRWLMTSKLPLRDQNGKIVGLVGIGRDITERKWAEQTVANERALLRSLVDHLPVAVYLKDLAGRKTLANPMELSYTGATSEVEVLGKMDSDLFPPEVAATYRADDQKVLDTGQPAINREGSFTKPDGSVIWFLTSKVPLRDATGRVSGLAGINLDITERKRAEEALRDSEGKLRRFTTQLERSNRELQDFAYVASHDLQEPLRKIVVFGERLKEKSSETLAPEALDYLARMQRAAGRMQILINDLLAFSRVTTKAHPFAPVNLAEIASEVVNDLEGRIELVKGRVELGTLPVIDAEALQMRQLLQNLMGNALKFRRPEEPPVVKVEAQIISAPDTPARKLCQLTISDNGIGFDEKYLDRIFNVFQRLHTRNEYEGTGMGLAIVRKIALYHGGDITAKSKPGQGATFILTIPVVHSQEAQDENTETTTNKENQP
jgi:PAS domain S-box-containing protein